MAEAVGPKLPPAIARITIDGFKSIVPKTTMVVRPLTILSGANSGGKSSMMQPLLLLKQTLEESSDPGPLLIYGDNVKFTSYRQMFPKIQGRPSPKAMGFGIELDNGSYLVAKYRFDEEHRAGETEFAIQEMIFSDGKSKSTLNVNMTHDDIMKATAGGFGRTLGNLEKHFNKKAKLSVQRKGCLLEVVASISEGGGEFQLRFGSPIAAVVAEIQSIIHVRGLRGNPERTYKTRAVGPNFPGAFEDYTASIIREWARRHDPRLRELGEVLRDLGLTWKITPEEVDDTQVELRVGRLPDGKGGGARDLVNVADVGFGVSQVLPVLAAVLTARPGQLVYIEQPEIHLHPRAQVALADFLYQKAAAGKRIVVETHSSLMLLKLQALAARDRRADLVGLNWFERDSAGITKVSSASIDEKGAFGTWPQDFGSVTLQLQTEFLDA